MKHSVNTILITGGAGFVGSNIAAYLKQKHPNTNITCLDNLRRRGSELNINRLQDLGINFVHGDIRNPEDLDLKEAADVLIECSADPSVMAGINSSPAFVINTNLVGGVNCLDYARKHNSRVIFMSSSRVYPYNTINALPMEEHATRLDLPKNYSTTGISHEGIAEEYPLPGVRSIYGATKLSMEYLMAEYEATYGIKSVINRCGVIGGQWQMGKIDQGLLSWWVAAHMFDKEVSYIGYNGTGKQVRDILHVDDLSALIELQVWKPELLKHPIYNVGGGRFSNLSLAEMTTLCQEITGKSIKIGRVKETRPVDIPWYITDNSKVEKDTGWKATKTPRDTIKSIYNWMSENKEKLARII